MITDTEVKQLNALIGGPFAGFCADDTCIIHNKWMLLELPASQVGVTQPWKGKIMEEVRQWRYNLLPDGEGERAMVFRSEEKIRLASDTMEAYINKDAHDLLYDILERSPEYYLFSGTQQDGSPNSVGIAVDGKIIGVVAQDVETAEDGWLTVE